MNLVLIGDALGSSSSLLATILFVGRHRKAWFISFIAIVVNIALYWNQKIYADTSLEIFYLVTIIYGAITWSPNKAMNDVRVLSYKNKSLAFIVTGLLYFTLTKVLYFYDNNIIKHLDSLTTALSLVAQYLMCRRYIETWVFWFITDALYFFMYSQKHLFWHSCLMLVYLALALVAYIRWYKVSYTPKIL